MYLQFSYKHTDPKRLKLYMTDNFSEQINDTAGFRNKANAYADKLNRKALWLSYFTVIYNILEGIVSVVAGAASGSIALVGFGLDSFLESISGSIMIWRFTGSGHSQEHDERKELTAIRLVAVSFFIFGAYVLFESVRKIYMLQIPDPSLVGIIIALVSIIVMPVLYILKRDTGKSVGSLSLVADSRQTLACVFLSFALLFGLLLNYMFGLWWADPAIGILIAFFLFKEGKEAWENREFCC